MKILFLADADSPHTQKWVNSLSEKGYEIYLFSFNMPDKFGSSFRNESFRIPEFIIKKSDGRFIKALYLFSLKKLKKIIKKFKPDIIHAHYASSYGLLGALSGFHPFIISVWGSDVYNFPNKSFLHKKILKFNLLKADKILSTSKVMIDEIGKYTEKPVDLTPFGVDLEKFKPFYVKNLFPEGSTIIGTVKNLEGKYGINLLIESFSKVKRKFPELPLKLLIVGGGSKEKEYKKLVDSLSISNEVIFTGQIDHSEIPKYQNMIDIPLFLSIEESESFGVSIIEASACEKPVIVSNIGGLPEVVENNNTGIVVEPGNIHDICNALEKLVLNKDLRIILGKNGRERVNKFYNWNKNLEQMENIYKNILEN